MSLLFWLFLGNVEAQELLDEDKQVAREAFEKGEKFFDAGMYPEALEQFQKSYRIMRHYKLLFNIALAYQFSGDLENAKHYFQEYQRLAPSEMWSEAQTRIESINAILAERASTVENNPAPAEESMNVPQWVHPTLLGIGIVGLGTGISSGVLSMGHGENINNNCEGICLEAARVSIETKRTQALICDLGIGIGLTALGTMLVLPKPSQKIYLTPSSFMIRGSF